MILQLQNQIVSERKNVFLTHVNKVVNVSEDGFSIPVNVQEIILDRTAQRVKYLTSFGTPKKQFVPLHLKVHFKLVHILMRSRKIDFDLY